MSLTLETFQIVNVVPDSPEWERERRNSLGASEVAAILNLSPYETRLTVYRSKLGVGRDDFDPELSFIGHEEENLMEKWLRRFHPEVGEILPAQMVRSVQYPWLHASLDRRAMTGGLIVPIQMKTAHWFAGDDWREGVPIGVQVQVQTEMFVFGAPFCWVVAFVGGRKFHLRRVERDEEFIREHLLPATEQFWYEHVLAKVEPEPSSLSELAEVYLSKPETTITGSEAVLDAAERRAVLLSDIKAQEAEADQLTLAIGTYMAENETLLDASGKPVLTYKTQQGRRGVVDIDALEAEHPEHVKRSNPFKVMRYVSAKSKEKAA